MTPRAPSVVGTAAPKPPVPPAASTPRALPPTEDGFFDDDMELRSSAVIPVADELKPSPPPTPPPPEAKAEVKPEVKTAPPAPPRAPSSTDLLAKSVAPRKPSPSQVDLGAVAALAAAAPTGPAVVTQEAQAQLFDVLRAVLDTVLVPLLEKQQELEARLETLQRAARPQPTTLAPVRSMAPSIDITPGSVPPQPRPSLIMTSYGPVSVLPGPAPRPAIEEALERVGPIDVPDFAGKRKFAGRIVIGVLIMGVIGAILATILSYS